MTAILSRRRGVQLAAVTTMAAALVGAGGATAQATPATDAAAWLSGQLTSNNHYVVGGTNDVGLTEDGLFAFKAAGAGYTTQVTNIKNWLNSTTNIGGGSTAGYIGSSTVNYPGALAKTSLAVLAAGGNPKAWTASSINMISRLEATLVTSGADAGRFADPRDTPTYYGYANPFTQALAIIAVKNQDPAFTGLASAVTYLRNQVCTTGSPAGGYPSLFGAANCPGDADTTGAATQALTYQGGTTNTTAAQNGNNWLNNTKGTSGSTNYWTNYCEPPNYNTLRPSANATSLAVEGLVTDPRGTSQFATQVSAGKSWLQSKQNTDGGLPSCNGPSSPTASDVRATTQSVQGLTGLAYTGLI